MVNAEHLARRARRAYELGRLRVAARAGWVLAPVVAICALETGAGEICACTGALLIVSALYLRWRDQSGVESVTAGLLAGSVPLLTGLLVRRWSLGCTEAQVCSPCTLVYLGTSLCAGIWLGAQARERFDPAGLLTALGIAVLAASLGCAGLGIISVASTALGLLAGSLASAGITRT